MKERKREKRERERERGEREREERERGEREKREDREERERERERWNRITPLTRVTVTATCEFSYLREECRSEGKKDMLFKERRRDTFQERRRDTFQERRRGENFGERDTFEEIDICT